MHSNNRSTCSTIHNCLHIFSTNEYLNRQEGGVSRSTSDGWGCTPYSFPESSYEPSSVILRCPLSNFLFLLIGSWLTALFGSGDLVRGGKVQSRVLWSLRTRLLHFRSLLFLYQCS